MPLNKLENFIKNTEGRILYVNPNDLDATDGIENQGNSLTKPFKTLQRALIESARFSYLRGNDNDIVEKTTILLFPGEHLIDNRPGFAIQNANNVAQLVSPGGATSFAQDTLTLTLNSNFDLTQEDNVLYKFNSIHGGVVVPRGTSVVGLDLRKTKLRPKYVPNPTDPDAPKSAVFRITGSCYFWQFSIFDGNESTLVYTDPKNFSETNQSKPLFSHHKLTVFEYADGVNKASGYDLTDLDMYYSKVGNAYNRASTREIDQKYPVEGGSFAKQRPEWEIVGAFASDSITMTGIYAGDGATPGNIVTVTTEGAHGLTADTPIKIRDVNVSDYNISTRVQGVLSETQFTYALPYVRDNLPAGPSAGLTPGNVTIETDTVSGASPYIFNCSLRSVWGMNGMHADGAKSSGFRSMVVAQFTGISLQKDDRAFVEYNSSSRTYNGIDVEKKTGAELPRFANSTNQDTIYHLRSEAIYRTGWETSHVRLTNDAILQIVSVFAIGYNVHFDLESGSDASITNSTSNFGQFALAADGFKKEAFKKDNKGFITSIVTPRSIVGEEGQVEWLEFDVSATKAWGAANSGNTNHIYLLGYTSQDIKPPGIAQGYRVGSKGHAGLAPLDKIYVGVDANKDPLYEATVMMNDAQITSANPVADGTSTARKTYERVSCVNSVFTLSSAHTLQNGEKVIIQSDTGDLPENIDPHKVYYAITNAVNQSGSDGRQDGITLSSVQIQLASSKTNADAKTPVYINCFTGGKQLRIESRVCDKGVGEIGHPIQWDPNRNQWFIHAVSPAGAKSLWSHVNGLSGTGEEDRTDISYLLRKEDGRSLDEKLYKVRYVIPKELENGRDPGDGFIIQESSSTNVRTDADFNKTSVTKESDYDYNRNLRFINRCTYNNVTKIVTVLSDRPHTLKVNDQIIVKGVTSSTNASATDNLGYNGTFKVLSIVNDKTFTYSSTDTADVVHNPGTSSTNDTNVRSTALPRFERNDLQDNFYVYRSETITPYQYNVQDGVYYLYVLNAGNSIESEFQNIKYSQSVEDLYPQLDKDNFDDNPESAVSYAKRSPLGHVVTNNQKSSITRETIDIFNLAFDKGIKITGVTGQNTTTASLTLEREHQLAGISTGTLNGGSGHTPGTYYNIKLLKDATTPSSAVWNGATANVTVDSNGVVDSLSIVEGGSGYVPTDASANPIISPLYLDSSTPALGGIGGAPISNVTIYNSGISTAVGNYVQVTGIGTGQNGYYRISTCDETKSIDLKKTASDIIYPGQYITDLGPVVSIEQEYHDATAGIATFKTRNTGSPHGLLKGNSFRVLDSSDASLGDFVVDSVIDVSKFTVKTRTAVANATYQLKHGISANEASADSSGENLGTRGLQIYDHDQLYLNETIVTDSQFKIKRPNGEALTDENISSRFPMGCYIQIDSEIMRITSSTLSGSASPKDEITVIRGSMGTLIEDHVTGSIIRKISPVPIELRRPSILRASGHTFEYVGYGPGNYSTSLPQVQIKSLDENEEFLAQSQERSCGQVVYTGMNNDGDFFVGNKRITSSTGQEATFDIPIPTITGEDPNRLSVVFDEVIVKERLLVEGGNSGQILSQFDGPVTFNGQIRFNEKITVKNDLVVGSNGDLDKGKVVFNNITESTSCTTGALVVKGGVGIGKNLNACGITKLHNTTDSTGPTSGALQVLGGVGINKKLFVEQTLNVKGEATFQSHANFGDADLIKMGDLAKFEMGWRTNGTYSHLKNTGSRLVIESNFFNVRNVGQTADYIFCSQTTGHVDLCYINSSNVGTSRLNTNSTGVYINGELRVKDDITAFASSDQRLKDNITPIEDPLAKVLSISGNTFTWNGASNKEGEKDTGVIAQEIAALELPGLTTVREDGTHAVKYERLTALLIEAVKELSGKVSDLEAKLNQ